jgi:hypothetical protein
VRDLARPVALECRAVAVGGPAVGLDDQPLLGPGEVGAVPGDRRPDERHRQPGVADQPQHLPLQFALGGGAGDVVDGREECGDAGAPCVRTGEVTRMPARTVTSPSANGGWVWMSRSGRERRRGPGTVISIGGVYARMRQFALAARCETAALRPPASIAANSRPRAPSGAPARP